MKQLILILTNGIIKIDAKYNYFENYNLTHIYKFYKNKKIFKEIKLDNISNIVNDKFEIQNRFYCNRY